MNATLFFATFDPLRETPDVCSLCGSRPPVFNYEFHTDDDSSKPQSTSGFCCASCSAELLRRLESAESRKWEEEETALAADDLDVTEFQKRRLATFEQCSIAGK
jgi:hypothetical protein